MRVADLDPNVLRGAGAAVGLILGLLATTLADNLPRRYGVTHVVTGTQRSRRNLALVVLSTCCSLGIAQVLTTASEASLVHATFLLVTNAVVATCIFSAAAIDLEHMILPNELTLGPAMLCIFTSPLRSVGLAGSASGAVVGLVLAYVPFLLYKRLRGHSGMGLGDAKLVLTAGAWHGVAAVPFVLFLGAMQAALGAAALHASGSTYAVPDSVKAEIRALRARAEAGDEEAKDMLADDPMTADARKGWLGMRLPLGPFLALGCIEVLFLRRWLVDRVLDWLL